MSRCRSVYHSSIWKPILDDFMKFSNFPSNKETKAGPARLLDRWLLFMFTDSSIFAKHQFRWCGQYLVTILKGWVDSYCAWNGYVQELYDNEGIKKFPSLTIQYWLLYGQPPKSQKALRLDAGTPHEYWGQYWNTAPLLWQSIVKHLKLKSSFF